MSKILFSVFVAVFLTTFSALAKEQSPEILVRNKMANIAKQVQKAKTVRDWIESSPKKSKLFRRTHYSAYMDERMPLVVWRDNAIVFILREKALQAKSQIQFLLEAKLENGKIAYFLNDKNVTRLPNENMNAWHKRIFGNTKQAATPASSLFFNTAHAAELNWDKSGQINSSQKVYWASIAASMSAEEWEQSDALMDHGFAAVDTSNMARSMVNDVNLSCGADKKAKFDFLIKAPGSYFRVETFLDRTVSPPQMRIWLNGHPNSGLPSANQKIGRLSVPVTEGSKGHVDTVYAFDARNGASEATITDWSLGRVLYSMDVRHPGETKDDESRAYSRQFDDYTTFGKNLIVMADVANAVCSNNVLRKDATEPDSGAAPAVTQ